MPSELFVVTIFKYELEPSVISNPEAILSVMLISKPPAAPEIINLLTPASSYRMLASVSVPKCKYTSSFIKIGLSQYNPSSSSVETTVK